MRPIDGDELVEYLERRSGDYAEIHERLKDGDVSKAIMYGKFTALVETMIDVKRMRTLDCEPVRHNQWALHEMNPHRVTVDGSVVCLECEHAFDRIKGTWFKRCPNCGAKMDAKEDAHD